MDFALEFTYVHTYTHVVGKNKDWIEARGSEQGNKYRRHCATHKCRSGFPIQCTIVSVKLKKLGKAAEYRNMLNINLSGHEHEASVALVLY